MVMVSPEDSAEMGTIERYSALVDQFNREFGNLLNLARGVTDWGELDIYYSQVTQEGKPRSVVTILDHGKSDIYHVLRGVGVVTTPERGVDLDWREDTAHHPLPVFDYDADGVSDESKLFGFVTAKLGYQGCLYEDPWGQKWADMRRVAGHSHKFWKYGVGEVRGRFPTAEVMRIRVESIPKVPGYTLDQQTSGERLYELNDIADYLERETSMWAYVRFCQQFLEEELGHK